MNKRAEIPTDVGEKTLFYILISVIFIAYISIFLLVHFGNRDLNARIPEQAKDIADLYGLMNCGLPDLNNLALLALCINPSPDARAYRYTFTLNTQKYSVQTANWQEKTYPERTSRPMKMWVTKDGNVMEAAVLVEAQHASLI